MKALVLGGIAWNTMVSLERLPEPRSQTVFATGVHEAVGSSGAGKAMNLKSLGVDVTLWGLVGEDEIGTRVSQTLEEWGVVFIPVIDPLGTQRHINLMNEDGGRVSIFVNPGSDTIDYDVHSLDRVAVTADVVSVTIKNHCRRLLPWLSGLGKAIWVDIHDYDGVNPHHREFIEAADYLFMSSVLMDGWRGFLEQAVAAGTSVGVCTHGADGASGYTVEDGWVDVPAIRVPKVVDSNGAGDGFFAGFATAWTEGSGLEAALRRGAAAAARAIQSLDLAPPTHSQ